MPSPPAATPAWIAGKTVLITGAGSGIGLETARALARRGARLLLVARTPESAAQAERTVRQDVPQAEVETLSADLALQAETLRTAAWAAARPRLDVLVNNVGAVFAKCELTADGVERQYAVNYVNQVLLTRQLLPLLARSGTLEQPSRVVVVSSLAHKRAKPEPAAFTGSRPYVSLLTYRQTKLAQALFATELARRLRGTAIHVNALCPGFTRTAIGTKHHGPVIAGIWWLAARFFQTPAQGAETVVYAAADDGLHAATGQFFEKARPSQFGPLIADHALAARLWSDTARLLKTPDDLPPLEEVSGHR